MLIVSAIRKSGWLWVAGVILAGPVVAAAVTVPFVEDFAADAANWREWTGTADATWESTGGPDNGSYVATTFNFQNTSSGIPGSLPFAILFRGQSAYGSSGGAFVGDWRNGVGGVSMYVRHSGPSAIPLQYFIRYADPTNFPGGVTIVTKTVQPDTWTRLDAPVPDPNMIYEGNYGFDAVFDNIGNVQVGVLVPESLQLQDITYGFDIDKVATSADDACVGVTCTSGQVCDPFSGTCVDDMCDGVMCPKGQECLSYNGTCVSNIPAVSTWGMIVMSLVLLSTATVVIRRRTPRIVVSRG